MKVKRHQITLGDQTKLINDVIKFGNHADYDGIVLFELKYRLNDDFTFVLQLIGDSYLPYILISLIDEHMIYEMQQLDVDDVCRRYKLNDPKGFNSVYMIEINDIYVSDSVKVYNAE